MASVPTVTGRVPVRNGSFNILRTAGQIVGATPTPEFLQRFAKGPFAALRDKYYEIAEGGGGAGGGGAADDDADAPPREPLVVVLVQAECNEEANPGGYMFMALVRTRAEYLDWMGKARMSGLGLEGPDKGASFVEAIEAAPPSESHAVFEFRLGSRDPVYFCFSIG